MSVEIIGALAVMAIAILVVLATRLAAPRRRRSVPAPAVSPADQRLLPYLKLTPAQWLSLNDFQRADLRQRAYRLMN